MASGEVYVTVDASMVNNGISTLAVSGNMEVIGSETLSFIITWQYVSNGNSGVTGQSWFYNDPSGPLYGAIQDGTLIPPEVTNEEEFNAALSVLPDDVVEQFFDTALGMWSDQAKATFWMTHREDIAGCLDAQYMPA